MRRASSERWVRLTSPGFLEVHDAAQEARARGEAEAEGGLKGAGAGLKGPKGPEEADDEEAKRELERLKEEVIFLQKGGRRNGRRQRSRSLHLTGRTRGGNGGGGAGRRGSTPNSTLTETAHSAKASWHKSRLSNKVMMKKQAQQKVSDRLVGLWGCEVGL